MVWLPLWSEIGSSFIKTGACVHEHTGRTCLSLRNDNPKWVHSWNHHILVSMITIFNMVWNREIVKSNLSSKGSCKTYVLRKEFYIKWSFVVWTSKATNSSPTYLFESFQGRNWFFMSSNPGMMNLRFHHELCGSISSPGTPNTHLKMDVWWFPTISSRKIWQPSSNRNNQEPFINL